jgi:hypothetical protein
MLSIGTKRQTCTWSHGQVRVKIASANFFYTPFEAPTKIDHPTFKKEGGGSELDDFPQRRDSAPGCDYVQNQKLVVEMEGSRN